MTRNGDAASGNRNRTNTNAAEVPAAPQSTKSKKRTASADVSREALSGAPLDNNGEAAAAAAPRDFPRDDPEGWVTHGWAAAPGQKRASKPVVLLEPAPPPSQRAKKSKCTDAAAGYTAAGAGESAAAAAEPAFVFVVGDRVEARWQASLPGVESSALIRKTHYYVGTVAAVGEDGSSYDIRFDDGDYETGVKQRFVRPFTKRRIVRPDAATIGTTASSRAWATEIDEGLHAAPDDDVDAWAVHEWCWKNGIFRL